MTKSFETDRDPALEIFVRELNTKSGKQLARFGGASMELRPSDGAEVVREAKAHGIHLPASYYYIAASDQLDSDLFKNPAEKQLWAQAMERAQADWHEAPAIVKSLRANA